MLGNLHDLACKVDAAVWELSCRTTRVVCFGPTGQEEYMRGGHGTDCEVVLSAQHIDLVGAWAVCSKLLQSSKQIVLVLDPNDGPLPAQLGAPFLDYERLGCGWSPNSKSIAPHGLPCAPRRHRLWLSRSRTRRVASTNSKVVGSATPSARRAYFLHDTLAALFKRKRTNQKASRMGTRVDGSRGSTGGWTQYDMPSHNRPLRRLLCLLRPPSPRRSALHSTGCGRPSRISWCCTQQPGRRKSRALIGMVLFIKSG